VGGRLPSGVFYSRSSPCSLFLPMGHGAESSIAGGGTFSTSQQNAGGRRRRRFLISSPATDDKTSRAAHRRSSSCCQTRGAVGPGALLQLLRVHGGPRAAHLPTTRRRPPVRLRRGLRRRRRGPRQQLAVLLLLAAEPREAQRAQAPHHRRALLRLEVTKNYDDDTAGSIDQVRSLFVDAAFLSLLVPVCLLCSCVVLLLVLYYGMKLNVSDRK
jgi:hypothetical protein